MRSGRESSQYFTLYRSIQSGFQLSKTCSVVTTSYLDLSSKSELMLNYIFKYFLCYFIDLYLHWMHPFLSTTMWADRPPPLAYAEPLSCVRCYAARSLWRSLLRELTACRCWAATCTLFYHRTYTVGRKGTPHMASDRSKHHIYGGWNDPVRPQLRNSYYQQFHAGMHSRLMLDMTISRGHPRPASPCHSERERRI